MKFLSLIGAWALLNWRSGATFTVAFHWVWRSSPLNWRSSERQFNIKFSSFSCPIALERPCLALEPHFCNWHRFLFPILLTLHFPTLLKTPPLYLNPISSSHFSLTHTLALIFALNLCIASSVFSLAPTHYHFKVSSFFHLFHLFSWVFNVCFNGGLGEWFCVCVSYFGVVYAMLG